MRSFRCKLHWGSFVGHCFKCGGLGHFMAECTRTPIVEVSNTLCSGMVLSNQVEPGKKMKKTTDANQGNGTQGKKVEVLRKVCRRSTKLREDFGSRSVLMTNCPGIRRIRKL
jgi:hypothetical protein